MSVHRLLRDRCTRRDLLRLTGASMASIIGGWPQYARGVQPCLAPTDVWQPGLWLVADDVAKVVNSGDPIVKWPSHIPNIGGAHFQQIVKSSPVKPDGGPFNPPILDLQSFHDHAGASFNNDCLLIIDNSDKDIDVGVEGCGIATVFIPHPQANHNGYLFQTHLTTYNTRIAIYIASGVVTFETKPVNQVAMTILKDVKITVGQVNFLVASLAFGSTGSLLKCALHSPRPTYPIVRRHRRKSRARLRGVTGQKLSKGHTRQLEEPGNIKINDFSFSLAEIDRVLQSALSR